jgi:bis(5'-nucleosidyl)-tetraphosphatase
MADREHARPPQKPVKREISAGIIVFRKTQDGPKFLILYHGGNYWNFPKGHIESEEKSLATAFRETKEEAGISSRDLRLIPNFKTYERFYFKKAGQPIFKIVIFYLAETRTKDVKISEEHHGYGWFLFRDAQRILGKYRDSQKVLSQAYHFLRPPSARKPTPQKRPQR